VDAVTADPARTDLLHEEKIELLERVRHARQKAAFLPTLGGRKPGLRACATMVDLQQERTEQFFELPETPHSL
jgi:hypothetical protein